MAHIFTFLKPKWVLNDKQLLPVGGVSAVGIDGHIVAALLISVGTFF